MNRGPTLKRIAAAARELLDAEGVEGVTMRRVASAVGITAMAVYRHYQDRDSLLNALADEGFTELAGQLQETRLKGELEARMRKLLDVNLNFALARPRLFELMFLQPRRRARQFPRDFVAGRSPTANRFAELVSEGMRQGMFQPNDVWEIVFESGALWQGLVMLYLGGRVARTEQEFREMVHRAMQRYLNGIRN